MDGVINVKAERKTSTFKQELTDMHQSMKNLIIGQDPVLKQIVNSFSRIMAGLNDKERCLLSLMLLGPTGVGKTETVRVLAELLFGDRRAFTRINCQEYSSHYNLSKMLGSPPGYVGGEIKPLLCQENLDRHFHMARANFAGLISDSRSRLCRAYPLEGEEALSILLFDEIEKAHPKVWNILLSIIEDGSLVLGHNEEVDFSNTIVIVTSNVGAQAISSHINGGSIGFNVDQDIDDLRKELSRRALKQAKLIFPPELLNRMDGLLTFNLLGHSDLLNILEILICRARGRIYTCNAPFLLEFTDAAKEGLVQKIASEIEYGARPLKRTLEQEVITPISFKICNGDIMAGDLVTVDVEGDLEFVFHITEGIEKSTSHGIILPSIKSAEALSAREDGGESIPLPRTRRRRREEN